MHYKMRSIRCTWSKIWVLRLFETFILIFLITFWIFAKINIFRCSGAGKFLEWGTGRIADSKLFGYFIVCFDFGVIPLYFVIWKMILRLPPNHGDGKIYVTFFLTPISEKPYTSATHHTRRSSFILVTQRTIKISL